MNIQPMPPVPPEIALRITQLAASGITQEQLILEMRRAGLHIIDCMRLMTTIYGMSRRDAKMIVHESDAWASMRGEYDKFHDLVELAARQAGFVESDTPAGLQKAS